MIRRPPRSTRTDTLFPYTTLFRSFRRPLLILIVLTIISPALLAAYGEQTPAPLADTQPRFDTTRAGSPGLARREVPLWPENSSEIGRASCRERVCQYV